MKFFTNKKTVQKIIIALVLVILCNFIVPTYNVQAADLVGEAVGTVMSTAGGYVTDAIVALIITLLDAAFNGVQNFMIGGDYHLSFMHDRDKEDTYYRSTRWAE